MDENISFSANIVCWLIDSPTKCHIYIEYIPSKLYFIHAFKVMNIQISIQCRVAETSIRHMHITRALFRFEYRSKSIQCVCYPPERPEQHSIELNLLLMSNTINPNEHNLNVIMWCHNGQAGKRITTTEIYNYICWLKKRNVTKSTKSCNSAALCEFFFFFVEFTERNG